jgi:hypothetical protein
MRPPAKRRFDLPLGTLVAERDVAIRRCANLGQLRRNNLT